MVTVVGFSPQYVKRVECRKCASVLEYVEREIQTRSYTDISGVRDDAHFIVCPSCGNEVHV